LITERKARLGHVVETGTMSDTSEQPSGQTIEQPKGDAARPLVTEPFHTAELPPLPQRERRLPASLWIEAPEQVRQLGIDLGHELVVYKRRIGSWLLWRAGPAVDDNARYMALHTADLTKQFTFTLDAEGKGTGIGPDGVLYDRFRTWKESLRDTL
jgi:hypothetical protein